LVRCCNKKADYWKIYSQPTEELLMTSFQHFQPN